MPSVKTLDSSAQLMNVYIDSAIRFAKASREGRERGDLVQAKVASDISGNYMLKVKMLKEASV